MASDPGRETAFIVFVRPPILGTVKTRLANHIGPQRALEIYLRLLTITAKAITPFQDNTFIFHAAEQLPLHPWPGNQWIHRLQSQGDLGQRMENAFTEVLAQYPKAILLGSDCPALTSRHLNQAVEELDGNDVVLGPAEDGGYYLIGMHKVHKALFENIPWSTSAVASETRNRILEAGLTLRELPALRDLDTVQDLEAIGW